MTGIITFLYIIHNRVHIRYIYEPKIGDSFDLTVIFLLFIINLITIYYLNYKKYTQWVYVLLILGIFEVIAASLIIGLLLMLASILIILFGEKIKIERNFIYSLLILSIALVGMIYNIAYFEDSIILINAHTSYQNIIIGILIIGIQLFLLGIIVIKEHIKLRYRLLLSIFIGSFNY